MEKTKEQLEQENSAQMNQEAIDRIKKEQMSAEESERKASVFFEDDDKFNLRDGKTYYVPPCSLKKARRLMQLIGTINTDAIIVNFIPTGDEAEDNKREENLFEILSMAFVNYPEVDRDYIDENVDLETARKIIETLIGLNGLKKSL